MNTESCHAVLLISAFDDRLNKAAPFWTCLSGCSSRPWTGGLSNEDDLGQVASGSHGVPLQNPAAGNQMLTGTVFVDRRVGEVLKFAGICLL